MYLHYETTVPNAEQFDDTTCNLFFRKLRPLLLFGKIIGICSVEIFINDVHLLSHNRNNCFVIFAIVLRVALCMCSVMKSVFGEQLDIEECLANLINVLATVSCLYTDKILVKMILKISRISLLETESGKCVYGSVIICIILSIHLSRIFDFISAYFNNPDYFSYTKFFIVVYHNCTCVLIIIKFLLFIYEIRRLFECLNKTIEVMLIEKVATEKYIEMCRNHYEELICIVEDLNSSVGMRLLIPIVAIPSDLLVYFYRFVFEQKWRLSVLDFSILFLYFFGVHCICSAGSEMKKMSHETFKILSSVPVMRLNSRAHLTLKLFQEHIFARPVEISAAGFFSVDKQLITSVLLAITTYCTVILQIVNKN